MLLVDIAVSVPIMPAMVSVTMKKMHQGAREQQQVGQYPEKMGAVFGIQKETGNSKKSVKYPTGFWLVVHFVLISHDSPHCLIGHDTR